MAVLIPHSRRPMSLALLSCTTALALCLTPHAQAQDAEETFLGTILLDPDYVRARDPNGNAADRINSQHVADAELDRARMGDLKDLFREIASVSVGGGIPIAQKIFVNGVDMPRHRAIWGSRSKHGMTRPRRCRCLSGRATTRRNSPAPRGIAATMTSSVATHRRPMI